MTRWLPIFAMALLLPTGAGVAAPPAEQSTQQSLTPLPNPFPAPDFSLRGEDGKPYRLADFRGQVVVLNFWATWCPPCRYEMPSMERAHKKVQGEKIALLAVNVGESEEQVFEFTGRYPVTFPLLLDEEGKVIRLYPVIGLPTTFIIDPRGRVTHRAVGGREWDEDRLLGQLRQLIKTPGAGK